MSGSNFTPKRPKNGIIGHRGLPALAPENTMSSFRLAAEKGLDWIEFDVRLTKDGSLVIFHDETLERTTYSIGAVHQLTLAQLRQCDAGSWFSHHYVQEKIPVLEEAIPELLKLGLYMNIEIKTPAKPDPRMIQRLAHEIIRILHYTWPKNTTLPLISSFCWPLLTKIRALEPEVPLGFLHPQVTREMIETLSTTPNASLHTHYRSLSVGLLTAAKQLHVPVLAYTVNEPHIAQSLLHADIFAIFSDNPPHLLKDATWQEKDPRAGTFEHSSMLPS